MPFALDNQTMIYIGIGIAIVYFFVMRYITQRTIETEIQKHNKKILKKVTEQVTSTFRQYVGNDGPAKTKPKQLSFELNQTDSIEDPLNGKEQGE